MSDERKRDAGVTTHPEPGRVIVGDYNDPDTGENYPVYGYPEFHQDALRRMQSRSSTTGNKR